MRTPTAWCVHHPVATMMLFLGLLAGGAIAGATLGIDLLPELHLPRLVVSAACPGLPATEVRPLLTIPLEDALASAKGVRRIASVSREGISTITLDFHWGTDMEEAAMGVRETIDVVSPSLPAEAARPVVLPVDPGEDPVVVVGVFPRDGDLAFARRAADSAIRSRLAQVAGVGSVTVVGGVASEVRVAVDQAKMASRGLTLQAIAGSLAATLFEYPAGTVREGRAEYLVKAVGPNRTLASLADCRLTTGPGAPAVRLGDIAAVSLESTEPRSAFQLDGRDGVGLSVRRQAGWSPVGVAAGVRGALAGLRASWGNDLELVVARDLARPITGALRDLVVATAAGCGIAFIVLLVSVRRLSTAGLLISTVPVSILISLAALRLAGRTINVMSVGGFSLGIGMMVDNSVVILENLQRRLLDEGRGVTPATVAAAADELAGANIGSTVTSVIVFLPVVLLPGILGALFLDLSLSVICSQVASFLVSITLVPVAFMLVARRSRAVPAGARRGGHRVERAYRALLRGSLRRPGLLAAALALLTAAGALGLRVLPFELLPPVDSGELAVTMSLPHGATLERSATAARAASARLLAVPGVSSVYARAGGEPDDPWYHADPAERPGLVHLAVALAPGPRPSAFALVPLLERELQGAGAQVAVELPTPMLAPLLGLDTQATVLTVTGADQAEARGRAAEVAAKLGGPVEGSAVMVSPAGLQLEVHLVPDRDAMSRAGVTPLELSSAVRSALDGIVAARIPVDGRDTDVRVRLRTADAWGVEDLAGLLVGSAGGHRSRLADLARVEPVSAPPALLRRDRQDAAEVRASAASAADGRRLEREAGRIAAGFPGATSEQSAVWGENRGALVGTFLLVVLLLYLALGAQFESFGLPLLFLVTLPLGFSGIVAALALAGSSLNLDSLLGVIVLFGVAVNNAIILSETCRERLAGGSPPTAAVYRGASDRLRPILITASTTVLALAPVAVDPGRTSTQSSMALAIIGGLAVSTPLALFVVPQLLLAVARRSARRRAGAAGRARDA